MSNESLIIKIVGKISMEIPEINNDQQIKIRNIITEELDNYIIESRDVEVMPSDLEEKILMFLSTKQLEGMSSKTLYNYKLQLRRFCDFIKKPVITINVTDIRSYLSHISKGVKETTLATKIFTLKSFFKWLIIEDIIEKNPMDKIKQPKIPKRLREPLSQDEVELLRQNCVTPREKAMFEFALATGCRLSEITQLNINDIDWTNLCVHVIGKGDKERICYFSHRSKLYL